MPSSNPAAVEVTTASEPASQLPTTRGRRRGAETWKEFRPMPLRALLFDAAGTLIYPDPPVAVAYTQAGRRLGSRLTEDQIRQRFASAWQRFASGYLPPDVRLDEQVERLRWQQIVATVFDDVPHAGQALFEQLWQHFSDSRNWALFPDVARTWSQLEASGQILGIASNFDERLCGILQGLPPLDTCRHLFISSQVGYAKPDPRFFQRVQETLGISPEEILLVGDDRRNDFEGARNAGWQALLVDRERPSSSEDCLRSLAEIPSRRNLFEASPSGVHLPSGSDKDE